MTDGSPLQHLKHHEVCTGKKGVAYVRQAFLNLRQSIHLPDHAVVEEVLHSIGCSSATKPSVF